MPHLLLKKVDTATAARDARNATNAREQRAPPRTPRAPALCEKLPDGRRLATRWRAEAADWQLATIRRRMGDDAMPYATRLLQGEKVSIDSPLPASGNVWPAVSLWGVVALWAVPFLMLSRYQPDQLLVALAHVSLKPTGGELLTLALMLSYVVLTGLMLGMVAGLPRRKTSRVVLRIAFAPLVTFSLFATLTTAVPLFLGTLIMWFPGLM